MGARWQKDKVLGTNRPDTSPDVWRSLNKEKQKEKGHGSGGIIKHEETEEVPE